mgnify:CR=1 FL=1|jgi:hypothetical protein
MSFEQAKIIAKAAVDLDRGNRHHEALQYYIDAAQMLIALVRLVVFVVERLIEETRTHTHTQNT